MKRVMIFGGSGVALMQALPPHVSGVHLKSRRAVAGYLEALKKQKGAGD